MKRAKSIQKQEFQSLNFPKYALEKDMHGISSHK